MSVVYDTLHRALTQEEENLFDIESRIEGAQRRLEQFKQAKEAALENIAEYRHALKAYDE